MFYNFLKPRKAFEEALANENLSDAWIIALLTGVMFGISAWLFSGETYPAIGMTILMILQWVILAGIIYVFEFMMKNKKKRIAERSFGEIISATGKLWELVLILSILLIASIVIKHELISITIWILLTIIGILFLYNLFILLKVVLDAKNLRTFVSLILVLIIHTLLTQFVLMIMGIIL
ncbi:MAG: hypothetical protein GX950_00805 [Candidatus Diapherotrites archaeon]|jgi:hypothetical protein|uniref:Yip1 domain-containing protein n=1 Tax=Candidatus Iainarchaeum sp. TaxID=3101447 RepID=A0A7K4BYP2_9ARCH|nr:hypothetical protein [Candidatus Diapherotrites archaeon]